MKNIIYFILIISKELQVIKWMIVISLYVNRRHMNIVSNLTVALKIILSKSRASILYWSSLTIENLLIYLHHYIFICIHHMKESLATSFTILMAYKLLSNTIHSSQRTL